MWRPRGSVSGTSSVASGWQLQFGWGDGPLLRGPGLRRYGRRDSGRRDAGVRCRFRLQACGGARGQCRPGPAMRFLLAEAIRANHSEFLSTLAFASAAGPLSRRIVHILVRERADCATAGTALLRRMRHAVPLHQSQGCHFTNHAYDCAAMTGFLRVPMPVTLTSTTSPGASVPTPEGVPVAITSPGSSVITCAM